MIGLQFLEGETVSTEGVEEREASYWKDGRKDPIISPVSCQGFPEIPNVGIGPQLQVPSSGYRPEGLDRTLQKILEGNLDISLTNGRLSGLEGRPGPCVVLTSG